MTTSVPQFITRKNSFGEEYAEINPEYKKYITNIKYDFFLKKSGIPIDYWDIEFEDYEGDKSRGQYETILKFAKNPFKRDYHNWNLYLWGDGSNQKSMLACNVGKEFIKNGLSVYFILAGTLINNLLKIQSYNRDEEIEKEIKQYRKCDLLIIDDIFDPERSLMWRNSKELIVSEWDSFFRERISNDKRMILTSNATLSSIKNDYGDSIYNLLDRNLICLELQDSIIKTRKKRFENI